MIRDNLVKIENRVVNYEECFPYKGWMKDCCDLLGVDTYWLWRFSKGFDQGLQLKIITSDCFVSKEKLDDVSCFGLSLRKKWISKNGFKQK